MTEQEWLASTDPTVMLEWVTRHARYKSRNVSDRKLRLFACACVRQVWHLLMDERSRRAVEVAERYADGQCTTEEYHSGWEEAWDVGIQVLPAPSPARAVAWLFGKTDKPGGIAAEVCALLVPAGTSGTLAALLREIVGNPFQSWHRFGQTGNDARELKDIWLTPQVLSLAQAAYDKRPGRECEECSGTGYELEESKGSNFCNICHGTGRIEDGTLDPVRMAILADALEEAGCPQTVKCPRNFGEGDGVGLAEWFVRERHSQCDDCNRTGRVPHPVLAHLSSLGPHVRGCWVLDKIMGRE